MMVVQFGLAMMLRGWFFAACGLISGTTSGTSASIRKADELSITTAPAAAAEGANSLEIAAARAEQRDVHARRTNHG